MEKKWEKLDWLKCVCNVSSDEHYEATGQQFYWPWWSVAAELNLLYAPQRLAMMMLMKKTQTNEIESWIIYRLCDENDRLKEERKHCPLLKHTTPNAIQ